MLLSGLTRIAALTGRLLVYFWGRGDVEETYVVPEVIFLAAEMASFSLWFILWSGSVVSLEYSSPNSASFL